MTLPAAQTLSVIKTKLRPFWDEKWQKSSTSWPVPPWNYFGEHQNIASGTGFSSTSYTEFGFNYGVNDERTS
ncbi:hypothetical protein SAMN05421784_10361 [Xenorhabdus koppenhoeferi]|uniref:Uncharacterized protein n=1 Tax=Xenorhabdus koppenhoeferi TaxID=351659 RepID=A0A1I7F8Q9_9GAMM|nr:hypothetical protein SAMN05421784_10361 [Xenorhabdus koppenhoeferi]